MTHTDLMQGFETDHILTGLRTLQYLADTEIDEADVTVYDLWELNRLKP